jgi:hypothetical protein
MFRKVSGGYLHYKFQDCKANDGNIEGTVIYFRQQDRKERSYGQTAYSVLG